MNGHPAPPEDALYVIPPEQFVASRDALARQLRGAGDKAEAARIAKLRRPSATAWALNQVGRSRPDLIEGLLRAGDELRAAMDQAVGGNASGLRSAQAGERAAVDAVVTAAVAMSEQAGAGVTEVVRQRMAATLRAAIVDPSVAQRLRVGMLEADHEAPGFGMDSLLAGGAADVAPQTPADQVREPLTASGAASGSTGGAATGSTAVGAQRLWADAGRLAHAAGDLAREADRLAEVAEAAAVEAERAAQEAEAAADEAERAAQAAARTDQEAKRLAAVAEAAAHEANQAGARAAQGKHDADAGQAAAAEADRAGGAAPASLDAAAKGGG